MATDWPSDLWLVRHGESEGNVADRRAHELGVGHIDLDCRDADVALSPAGRQQAESLGKRLATFPDKLRPTVVLSSPYVRAADTARIAVSVSGLDVELRHDERLRERELGIFDGLTGKGIRERYPEESERRSVIGKFYYRPPGGESWCDVALRVRSMVESLRQEYAGERVLVASHQAVVMVFRYVLEGMSEAEVLEVDATTHINNCSLTHYSGGPGGWTLKAFNDTAHIDDSSAPKTDEPSTEESAGDDSARGPAGDHPHAPTAKSPEDAKVKETDESLSA